MMKNARHLFTIAVDDAKSDAFTILMVNVSDLAPSTAMTTKRATLQITPTN
jgi:hypothetical protein